MKSRLFSTDLYHEIEGRVASLLNSSEEFLSVSSLQSPRAAGDAIQDILENEFGNILGKFAADYSARFARRAMADLAFTDRDALYYIVDVKTHRTDTQFNMPNLTSVERLTRFYEDDSNIFAVLLVSYHIEAQRVVVTQVTFVPIEFLSWDCLTVGALGWGQIQIANANHVIVDAQSTRRQWMLDLCNVMLEFYPREITKISRRITRFEQIRQFWLSKSDE